ncbi:hypothetical protein D917_07770 [Trichinella nativa]|uniref:Uncharacterized protein n=1 Tax=Trichinella nativa TaxID=6335 RepID=A0A1Y3ENL6_9BILA|nr:hypothetical protein D917_07770 [Trichinella nativa]
MKKSRKMKTDVSVFVFEIALFYMHWFFLIEITTELMVLQYIIDDDETLLMEVSNSSVIKSRSRVKSGRKCRPEVDFSAGITSPLYAMETDNMESVLPTKARQFFFFAHSSTVGN